MTSNSISPSNKPILISGPKKKNKSILKKILDHLLQKMVSVQLKIKNSNMIMMKKNQSSFMRLILWIFKTKQITLIKQPKIHLATKFPLNLTMELTLTNLSTLLRSMTKYDFSTSNFYLMNVQTRILKPKLTETWLRTLMLN